MVPKKENTALSYSNDHPGILKRHDLESLGIPPWRIRTMIHRGEMERIARGLYRMNSTEVSEYETLVSVCARMPQAIVCLLSALQIHGIGTQVPREVWVALDRKARKPSFKDLPVRVVRFSGQMLTYGIETREIQGIQVRITSPARTVVDCFRYRAKIGMDVALEALQEALRSGKTSVDAIMRAAEVCRIITVIKPYLEVVVA